MEFDRTEDSYLNKKINELVSSAQVGKVTKVYEHTQDGDDSNFEVDVELLDSEKTRRRVPVLTLSGGFIHPPQKDEHVLVLFLASHMQSEAPVVFGHVPTVENPPTKGKAGTFRAKRGNLYTEMDKDGNKARIAKKSGDMNSPSSKVEVDDSGSQTKINIEAEGDVIIDSSNGNVILGGSSGTPVARKGDPVSVTDGSGNTYSGQIDDGSNNVDSA